MNLSKLSGVAFWALATMYMASCDKKKSTPINHKITAIIDTQFYNKSSSGNDAYGIRYNKDSSVSMIVRGSLSTIGFSPFETWEFHYEKDRFFAISADQQRIDTFYTNSAGQILSVMRNDIIYNYSYDNLGQLVSMTTKNFATSTFNYIWSDGNISYSLHNTSRTNYEYYTDLPSIAGDGLQINEFIKNGRAITRNKNLIKSIKPAVPGSGTTEIHYSYSFDNNYRIIKTTISYITPTYHDTVNEVYHFRY